jgi:hypothetical protein
MEEYIIQKKRPKRTTIEDKNNSIEELNNHININNPRALLARMMPLVEQELLPLLEHTS